MPVWAWLAGIGIVALLTRVVYLIQVQDAPFFGLRLGDAAAYDEWARRIAGGDWLGKEVFYQAPLYPYFLAVVYGALGDSAMTVRGVQAVIGALSCVLLGDAGYRIFGRKGLASGLGLAVYAPAIFLDGMLEKAPLVTLFTTVLLALLALTRKRWLLTGACLGLLSLTRENALLLAAPILLWIGLGEGAKGLRVRQAALFLAGCFLILVPVAGRNYWVAGEFHLTTAQLGPNFYIGNHAGARGSYEALVEGHGSAADERADATRLAEASLGRKLSPGEVSAYWLDLSLRYIRSQPLDWLSLLARKLALTFNGAEIADTESQEVYAEYSPLLRFLSPFSFAALLALAMFGVFATLPSWRRFWLFYAIALTYAFSTALFYVFARYRFPIVPVLLLMAAGGFAVERRRIYGGLAMGVLAFAFACIPLNDSANARAAHYSAIATALAKQPQGAEEGIAFYRRGLQWAPEFPAAQLGLGTLLARSGRNEEALGYYRAALRTWPEYTEARFNLGMALAATGRAEEAARELEAAIRGRPDDVDARIALAKSLVALKRPDEAARQFEEALRLAPRDGRALVGLGVALTQLGKTEEALRHYRTALEIDPKNAAANNSMGFTLASDGKLREAAPYFERAVALNPNDADSRRNLEQIRRLLAK